MSLYISIFQDPDDQARLRRWFEETGKRASRAELLPILKEGLKPIVQIEKSILRPHRGSGALEASLTARSGAGDWKETMSVFAAPTATRRKVIAHWSRGRAQQRAWAAKIPAGRGKTAVFYGPIVHQGHRIVKRRSTGELYDTGKFAKPIPFAADAMSQAGQREADVVAGKILDHILGA